MHIFVSFCGSIGYTIERLLMDVQFNSLLLSHFTLLWVKIVSVRIDGCPFWVKFLDLPLSRINLSSWLKMVTQDHLKRFRCILVMFIFHFSWYRCTKIWAFPPAQDTQTPKRLFGWSTSSGLQFLCFLIFRFICLLQLILE